MLTAADFLALSDEERRAAYPSLTETCAKCERPDNGALPASFPDAGERVCEDCYFEALGALVEKHPIGWGSSGHGCGSMD
jgi:hypothetical protein